MATCAKSGLDERLRGCRCAHRCTGVSKVSHFHQRCRRRCCSSQTILSRPQTCSLKRRQSQSDHYIEHVDPVRKNQATAETAEAAQRPQHVHTDRLARSRGRVFVLRCFLKKVWTAAVGRLPPSSAGCSSSAGCDRFPNLVHVPNCSTDKCLHPRPGLLPSLVPFHPRLERESPEGDKNVKIMLFNRSAI